MRRSWPVPLLSRPPKMRLRVLGFVSADCSRTILSSARKILSNTQSRVLGPTHAATPAMKPTMGFCDFCGSDSRYSATSNSIGPPTSPISTIPGKKVSPKKKSQLSIGREERRDSVANGPSVVGSERRNCSASTVRVPGDRTSKQM
jgi:hypothetical protein